MLNLAAGPKCLYYLQSFSELKMAITAAGMCKHREEVIPCPVCIFRFVASGRPHPKSASGSVCFGYERYACQTKTSGDSSERVVTAREKTTGTDYTMLAVVA